MNLFPELAQAVFQEDGSAHLYFLVSPEDEALYRMDEAERLAQSLAGEGYCWVAITQDWLRQGLIQALPESCIRPGPTVIPDFRSWVYCPERGHSAPWFRTPWLGVNLLQLLHMANERARRGAGCSLGLLSDPELVLRYLTEAAACSAAEVEAWLVLRSLAPGAPSPVSMPYAAGTGKAR